MKSKRVKNGQNKLLARIAYDPGVLGGKPVIKGTRISVALILNLLAHGMTPTEILDEYPHLKMDDVRAALEYARLTVENEEVILQPSAA